MGNVGFEFDRQFGVGVFHGLFDQYADGLSLGFGAGVGGWSGAVVSGGLNPVDGTAALGFANAMADLGKHTTKGGMLYVFALP